MRRDDGFTLIGLLVVVALINISLAVAVTSWVTIDKRAQEAELIFRGQQYVRALRCHQQQEGGPPDDLDELLETDCIRALYPDPMSPSGEWRVIRESDLEELGAAGGGRPPASSVAPAERVSDPARVDPTNVDPVSIAVSGVLNERLAAINRELTFSENVRTAGEGGAESGRGVRTERLRSALALFSRIGADSAIVFDQRGRAFGVNGNGIVGVASSSTDASLRLYEGETTYDKWRFLVR